VSSIEGTELEQLIKSAETGDAAAQNLLAAKLATGEGVKQDILGSVYWYSQAAAKGYSHAMWNLGSMLVDGEIGLRADRELGMKLIAGAAQANQNSACLFLSECYSTGSYGLAKNQELTTMWQARAWDWEKAADYTAGINITSAGGYAIPRPAIYRAD
jgi:TPR repeat protein